MEKIIENNRLIAEFMGLPIVAEYRDSGMKDCNGNLIFEGSIINANGYESDISDPEDISVHAVEYCEGQFGSDVYSDFEPLSIYKSIEVVGHVRDYAHKLDNFNEGIDGFEWSGNLGAAIKKNPVYNFHKDWNSLMSVVDAIENPKHIGVSAGIDITYVKISAYCSGHLERGLSAFSYKQDGRRFNGKDKLEAVYKAVIAFINWYNHQTPQP